MVKAKTSIPLRSAADRLRLPGGVRQEDIVEYRLRAGHRIYAVTADGRRLPCSDILRREDIMCCFDELCKSSVHSFSREIREGYITLEGGHRVGICGTAVTDGGSLQTVRDISSLNIRIAREVRGCAEYLYKQVFGEGLCSLLIAGPPLSGKTTVLRDLTRLLGSRWSTALIDSRSEIAAVAEGMASLDVGEHTDVLNGYPRYEGMLCALRSLSPQVMVCDELGGDAQAVISCMGCGVRVVASVHSADINELYSRTDLRQLLPKFDYAAVLTQLGAPPLIYRLGDGKGADQCV